MKITVKEVSGTKFDLDGVEATSTVHDVKALIQKAKGWEPALQKLVLAGKILTEDTKSLAEYVRFLDYLINHTRLESY